MLVALDAMDVVKAQLAAEIAAGEAAEPRLRPGGSGTVAEFAVQLKPGTRKAVPLGGGGREGWRRAAGRTRACGERPRVRPFRREEQACRRTSPST